MTETEPLRLVTSDQAALEEWRPGVVTRMLYSAATGSAQLCIFQQWCDPGLGAPEHLHAVEEVLAVLEGEAEVWVDDVRAPVVAGQQVLIPAGRWHGFRNTGTDVLRVQATLSAPVFEASYRDRSEITRRYLPG